jgi:HEPN domain-containing protein
MPPKDELVRDRFMLAQQDLDSARLLLRRSPPLLESGCFHCQPTIEKALKAVLLLNDQRPPRTHSLADLFGLCERYVPRLSAYERQCAGLNVCATDARYPDSRTRITPQSAANALAAVEEAFAFVLEHMPVELRT